MLSRSAEYALRIMACFALHEGDQSLRAKDIAEEVNIPVFYLSKILRRMVTGGLLKGTRGHGGGFTIARAPEKIRFAQILEAIEADIDAPTCVFGWDACSDKHPCVLHDRWSVLRKSFHQWANQTTLADVRKDVEILDDCPAANLREKIRKHRANKQLAK